jgi:cytochrome P450
MTSRASDASRAESIGGLPSAAGCPVSRLGQDFDPFAGDSLAWYGFMRRARAEEPVFYSPVLDYWVITRWDDVMAVLQDSETFSSANTLVAIKPPCPAALQVMGEYGINPGPSLVDLDPPEHSKQRQVFRKSFTPERVAALEPRSIELIDQALDRVVRRGEADVVTDLVWDAPAKVAFALMGVPEYEVNKIKTGTARMASFGWGVPSDEEQVGLATAIGEYWKFAEEQVDRLLADPPGENLMGDLIRAWREPGNEDMFSRDQLCWIFLNTLFAGHETTTNASAAGIRALLTDREQWEAICADPALIPNTVEEILRYDSSVPTWRRVTTRPTTLGKTELPEGAKLLICLGSANHDEAHFADGERFDIRRQNAKDQLAFSWGRHTCLGARLARMEMRVVLERLTRRLPHLQLVEDQEWVYSPNTSHRGPEHVLVRWDPAQNPQAEDRP